MLISFVGGSCREKPPLWRFAVGHLKWLFLIDQRIWLWFEYVVSHIGHVHAVDI